MIKKSEVAKLLGLAAAYDQRTTGDFDTEAWFAVAEVDRWQFATARRVIINHYRQGADRPRITPAAITDQLRALRNAAAESFEAPVIPETLAGRDYPHWYRAQLTAHIDAQIQNWADTGEEPSRSLPPTVNHSLAELVANAPEHVRAEMDAAARKITRRS